MIEVTDVDHDTLTEVATRSLCFWIEEHSVEVASEEAIPWDLRLGEED